jgi:hypothetical protein
MKEASIMKVEKITAKVNETNDSNKVKEEPTV